MIRAIPTTRYQGSKRKILPWLYECIKGYEFHTVLDAFGGSGMVSCLLKRMGKRVTYNDVLRFNQMIGATQVPNQFKAAKALEVFEQLIKKFRESIIVLSYRYGGTPTIDELSEMMRRYKTHLDVYDRHYKYALNKQNGDAALNREYLLIGW